MVVYVLVINDSVVYGVYNELSKLYVDLICSNIIEPDYLERLPIEEDWDNLLEHSFTYGPRMKTVIISKHVVK